VAPRPTATLVPTPTAAWFYVDDEEFAANIVLVASLRTSPRQSLMSSRGMMSTALSCGDC